MTARRQPAVRRWTWSPSVAPAPEARPYVHKLAGGALALAGPESAGLLRVDEGRLYARAVVTTPDRDRVGDEVRPEGCDLGNYRKNPVWFFGHQSVPFPVGVAEAPDGRLDVEVFPGSRVEAGCYFHQSTREACEVFDLVARRVLRGVSIAFNPLSEPRPVRKADDGRPQGLLYDAWELIENSWVGVPCNPLAGQVREYLSRDKAHGGGRVSALVRKALEPLAAPRRAWLAWSAPKRKYITHDGGEWVVHAEDGKVLGRHDSKADAERQLAAIEAHKHGKSEPEGGMAEKDMSAAGGESGGYALPEGVAEQLPETHHETASQVGEVMERHKADAPEGGPHDAYLHPGTGEVHHHHAEGASPEHLEAVKDGMAAVEGVTGLTQHHEPPEEGSGHVKVYDGAGEAEKPAEAEHRPDATEDDVPEHAKSLRWLFGQINKAAGGRSLVKKLTGESVTRFVKAAKAASPEVEECVRRKMPKLREEGYSEEQSLAIAYSMCGEKAAPAAKAKDFGGEEGGEREGDDYEAPAKPEGPPLATLIADLVSSLVALQERVAAADQPPPAAREEEEEEEETEEGDDFPDEHGRRATEAALDRYRRSGKASVRKMHERHKEDLMGALSGASEHLHQLADLDDGAFGRRHKAMCRQHARALDKHFGMISGLRGEPPPQPAAPQAAEGTQPEETGGLTEKDLDAIAAKLSKIEGRVGGLEAPVKRINPSWLRNGGR